MERGEPAIVRDVAAGAASPLSSTEAGSRTRKVADLLVGLRQLAVAQLECLGAGSQVRGPLPDELLQLAVPGPDPAGSLTMGSCREEGEEADRRDAEGSALPEGRPELEEQAGRRSPRAVAPPGPDLEGVGAGSEVGVRALGALVGGGPLVGQAPQASPEDDVAAREEGGGPIAHLEDPGPWRQLQRSVLVQSGRSGGSDPPSVDADLQQADRKGGRLGSDALPGPVPPDETVAETEPDVARRVESDRVGAPAASSIRPVLRSSQRSARPVGSAAPGSKRARPRLVPSQSRPSARGRSAATVAARRRRSSEPKVAIRRRSGRVSPRVTRKKSPSRRSRPRDVPPARGPASRHFRSAGPRRA